MNIPGYNGKILEVDLSRGKDRVIELDEETAYKFIGGRGLAAYILWKELGHKWEQVDPLGPENLLLFLTGPLTGYYPGVKLAVSGKSPQTNGVVGSVVSSELAIELRAAGYDGLIVKGASKDPVYIYIEGEKVEVRSAEHLWGLRGRETFQKLFSEVWGELKRKNLAHVGLTKEPSFVYIGPAGENMVRTAAVMAKLTHAAGYGGYGAVMGSKKLKAVVAKGFGPMPPAKHPYWVKLLIREAWNRLNQNIFWKQWGTSSGGYEVANLTSSEPIRNWQEEWHDARTMGVNNYEAHWVKRYWGDYGCPSTCMKISRLIGGKYNGSVTDGPDYELQAYLGPNLGVFEPRGNIYLSSLADDLGLCGIQTGNVAGFAAELCEKGILTREEVGFNLKWGDTEAFARLLEAIAYRKGIGDILAEGVARAADKLSKLKGQDLSRYAVHVKGIGIGAHGARSGKDFPQAFTYAVGVQGGDHTSPPRLPVEKAWGEFTAAFEDSAVICSFNAVDDLPYQFLKAITGWEISSEKWFREHARRIVSLQRVLLLLGGPDLYWDPRIHDDNPPRFYEPLPSGPFKGRAVDRTELEKQKKEYFDYLGWDQYGIPRDETLRELGIGELSEATRRIRNRLKLE